LAIRNDFVGLVHKGRQTVKSKIMTIIATMVTTARTRLNVRGGLCGPSMGG